MPFFSVVIPLYNKAKYIKATLNSVLKQNFEDFEIIIVDDGSTDQSAHLVSQIEDDRITIITQANSGASIARINGIKTAVGTYIALLDADDIWCSNHLTELHKLICMFPTALLYCTNYQIKRNADFITPAVFNFKFGENPLIIEDFFVANVINYIPSSSSSAFKKTDYFKISGYNKDLKSGQDIDLWVQFALKGEVAFNPKISMTYSFFDKSSLSNSDYNSDRFNFIYSYQKEEQHNPSLKFYLDINRYALALRYKFLGGHQTEIKTLIKDIDKKNLNFKQKFTLILPVKGLLFLKQIQDYLVRNQIYISAYK